MGKFQHYLKTASRSFRKHWLTASLSMLGLISAFSLSLISAVIIWDAWSSDGQWENAPQIYVLDRKSGYSYFDLPSGYLDDVRNASSEIVEVSSTNLMSLSFKVGNKVDSHWAQRLSSNFAEMFALETLAGDFAATIGQKNRVALSEGMALQLYGKTSAIGQILEVSKDGEFKNYTVGAVFKTPENTTLIRSKILLHYSAKDGEPGHQFFLKIRKGTEIDELAARLDTLLNRKYPNRESANKAMLRLVALRGAKLENLNAPNMKNRFYGLFYASLLMLLVALLNYASLSAAVASTKLKGIALRKILGARMGELALMHLLETLALVSLSYLLSIAMAVLISPYLGTVTGNAFTIISGDRLPLLISGWLIALVFGFVAAVFPIWPMVRNSTVGVLRGFQGSLSGGGAKSRFLLLVLQSMFGLGLAFGAGVTFFQISHLEQADKGFDTRGLLYIRLWAEGTALRDAAGPLVTAIRRVQGVENAALVYSANPLEFRIDELKAEHPVSRQATLLPTMFVGEQFIETLGLPVLAGRIPLAISETVEGEPEPDEVNVLVNQRLIEDYQLGLPDEALGKCLFYLVEDKKSNICNRITGVVGNHYQKLDGNPVTPVVFKLVSGNIFYNIMVRYKPGLDKEVLALVTAVWDSQLPSRVIFYRFLDDIINDDLGTQKAIAMVLIFIAIGSVFLVIAGLYAMAKFVVAGMGREIAIRRVLGASTGDVVQIVVIKLARPIILGALLGLPAAWYFALEWLHSFSVRIDPQPWHAVLMGLLGVCFILLAATSEILRAIRIRPANRLHHE